MGFVEPTEQAAYEWARATIRGTVLRLLRLSQERGVTPREAAEAIAIENTNALAEEYGTEEPVARAQASV